MCCKNKQRDSVTEACPGEYMHQFSRVLCTRDGNERTRDG